VAIGFSLIAEAIWLVIRSANSLGASADQGLSSMLSVAGLLSASFVFLVPRTGISGNSSFVEFAMAPYTLLTALGVIGWFFTNRGSGISRSWSIAAAIASVAFAPLMLVGMQIALGSVAPISPRYALVLAPVFLIGIAAMTRNSIATWIVLVYGGALSVFALLGFIH